MPDPLLSAAGSSSAEGGTVGEGLDFTDGGTHCMDIGFVPHEHETFPWRFARLKRDAGDIKVGTRVKVVMASRFGDLGITTDLKAKYGYSARVPVDWLEPEKPDAAR